MDFSIIGIIVLILDIIVFSKWPPSPLHVQEYSPCEHER